MQRVDDLKILGNQAVSCSRRLRSCPACLWLDLAYLLVAACCCACTLPVQYSNIGTSWLDQNGGALLRSSSIPICQPYICLLHIVLNATHMHSTDTCTAACTLHSLFVLCCVAQLTVCSKPRSPNT